LVAAILIVGAKVESWKAGRLKVGRLKVGRQEG
jgi:hypothetical protein